MKKHGKIFTLGALALCSLVAFSAPSFSAKAEEGGVRTVASYFQADENARFTTGVDTPSYVAQKGNGVLVQSENGGTFTYDNLIDAEDLTKERLLFEMQITPQTAGEYELNQFIVRLEDAENPRVYVNISLYNYLYGGTNLHGVLSHVTVKTNTVETYRSLKYNNKFEADKEKDNVTTALKTGVRQGTEIYAPLAGNKGGHSDSFKLYYDNATNALYTVGNNIYVNKTQADPNAQRDVLKECGFADEEGRFLVVDLDEHKHMGTLKSNLFTGFPSGKIKLSVTTNEVISKSASYMVMAIDGQTFDGKYLNDTTAPELSLDLLGYQKDQLPTAWVGKEYPVFDAVAKDKMYGEVDVSYTVLHGDDVLYCTRNGFVPKEAGEYVVCYEATDGNGNKAVERLRVSAVEGSAIVGELNAAGKEYDFSNESLKNANGNFQTDLYYPVYLPSMRASGGAGEVVVEREVTFAGKKVETVDGVFTPDKKGVYEIRYILRDYIGNIAVYEYRLETVYSDTPNLYAPNLPSYLTYGQATLFTAVNAELYSPWQQALQPYTRITIYREDGETVIVSFDGSQNAVYIPKEEDGARVIIEYFAAKDEQSEGVVYRQKAVLLPSDKLSNKFIKDEGVEMEMSAEGDAFDFIFTQDGQSVEFAGKLSIFGGLLLEFNVPKGMNGYDGVSFTIVDAYDTENAIVVSFYKNADPKARTSGVTVNGGTMGSFPASFHGNMSDYFVFTVSQYGEVYNFNEDVVAKAENFKGFTSGYVYVTMSVFDLKTDGTPAVVSWVSIKNQNFNEVSEYEDFVDPVLSVFEKPVGRLKLGEELFVSGASACDIFTEETTLILTVSFNGKEIYKEQNEFGKVNGTTLTLTDYGEYSISYYAVDKSGNSTSRNYTVLVVDSVSPTIIVDGEMPTNAKQGEKLTLPKAKAKDNKDIGLDVYIVVIDPMNVFTVYKQGETYIIPHKGRYIVKYYVEDKQCNTAYSEEFVLYVVE